MSFEDILRAPETQEAPAPAEAKRRSATRQTPRVGGLPQVSLLPAEVRDAGRSVLVRRALIGAVAASVAIAAGGALLAGAVAGAAENRLTSATARTQSLSVQIAKFSDVARLDQQLSVGKAAVAVGSSTEIDWKAQYDALTLDMPAGYTVKSMAAESATVTQDYEQGDSPLERPRVATVQLSVAAPDTTQLPGWLRNLRSTPAYADASASWSSGVGTDSQAGGVTVELTVHLDKKALVNQQEDQG